MHITIARGCTSLCNIIYNYSSVTQNTFHTVSADLSKCMGSIQDHNLQHACRLVMVAFMHIFRYSCASMDCVVCVVHYKCIVQKTCDMHTMRIALVHYITIHNCVTEHTDGKTHLCFQQFTLLFQLPYVGITAGVNRPFHACRALTGRSSQPDYQSACCAIKYDVIRSLGGHFRTPLEPTPSFPPTFGCTRTGLAGRCIEPRSASG